MKLFTCLLFCLLCSNLFAKTFVTRFDYALICDVSDTNSIKLNAKDLVLSSCKNPIATPTNIIFNCENVSSQVCIKPIQFDETTLFPSGDVRTSTNDNGVKLQSVDFIDNEGYEGSYTYFDSGFSIYYSDFMVLYYSGNEKSICNIFNFIKKTSYCK